MKARPLFPYPGSKWKQMPTILKLLPHHEHFVSVFGGSGTDIIAKPKSCRETFNELDPMIYNLFKVLQDSRQTAALKRKIAVTPHHCKRIYEDARSILKDGGTDVQKAWAFLVVSYQGFVTASPSRQTSGNWRFFRGRPACAKWPSPEYIDFIFERFCEVQVSPWTWQECVEKLDDPQVCFFLDPPYLPTTRHDGIYAHEMTVEDHEEMLDALTSLEGFAMLCGYDNDLYAEKVGHWRQHRTETKAHLNVGSKREPRVEVLWMNYDERGNKINGGNA